MTAAQDRSSLAGAGAQRVSGLDHWRFVLATWVVLGHVGFIPIPDAWKSGPYGLVVRGLYNNLFNGPAAVIVFFVISGFCIHFPFRRPGPLDLVAFYARRHVRIATPVAAMLLISRPMGVEVPVLGDSILWSLICEEAYYTLYPLIRRAGQRWGFWRLWGATYLVALGMVIALGAKFGNYPDYGWKLNWVLGLPCWVLGCQLATACDGLLERRPVPTRVRIWAWRMGMWALASALSVARFHSPLTYPWTLNLFAVVAFLWLREEITFAGRAGPGVFERAGRGSYSLYLFHLTALALYRWVALPVPHPVLEWALRVGTVYALCAAFYFAVERPSHRAARWLGGRILALRARSSSAMA
jgi:peptidoglycan/LPS O-acetylase OafA/YrhL